jgi:molecular chaperone GrpE
MNESKRSPETKDGSNQGDGLVPDQPVATEMLSELEALRARASELERERDQFLELLQRTRADFENYQKRVQRDLQQERRYADGALALELLPAIDSLERAFEEARKRDDNDPLAKGVGMVLAQLYAALRGRHIIRMEPLLAPFDPNYHQAVMQEPTGEHPPNSVLRILQPGYMIHDRVLRPASVVVAAPPQ